MKINYSKQKIPMARKIKRIYLILRMAQLKIFFMLDFFSSGFFLLAIPPNDPNGLTLFCTTNELSDCWAGFFCIWFFFSLSLRYSTSIIELNGFFIWTLFSTTDIFSSLIKLGILPVFLELALLNTGKLGLESMLS